MPAGAGVAPGSSAAEGIDETLREKARNKVLANRGLHIGECCGAPVGLVASRRLPDFGGQLADDIAHTISHLSVLPGVLAAERARGQRELEVLHHPRPGDGE